MVSPTLALFVRARGPDEFWSKRKIFKLAALYCGRRRDVYSITIRNVHRTLVYATKGRKLKKMDLAALWSTRVEAGYMQYDLTLNTFKEGLTRSNILHNKEKANSSFRTSKKVLSDLAVWEPRSFQALVNLSRERAAVETLPGIRERSVMNQVYGLRNLKLK